MPKLITPIALFFYTGSLTQVQATKVEEYYARGGYRTYFRRDVAGQRDIVEKHVKIVGGGELIPQRYVEAYEDDATRILDTNSLAAILANPELEPPTVTPALGFSSMSAPVDDGSFGGDGEATPPAPPAPPPAP